MTDKITLSLPELSRPYAETIWPAVAESARADGYHWIAEQIREQTKAPVEEPTEWGSVVRARRSPDVPLTLLTYVPEPAEIRDSRYSWYSDQDSWHIWSDLSDVEVLRVGVFEPAPEQVEADLAQDEQAHARYYEQAVRTQHADFLKRAKWAKDHGEPEAASIWVSAANLLQYLLPEEPTS